MTLPNPILDLRTLSLAGAQYVLAAAAQAAAERALKVSIAVADQAGNLICFQRLDQAGIPSIEAAIRKARTAAQLGAPTKMFEDHLNGGKPSLLTFEFVSASQGGIPLVVDNVVIGGIGCSGASGDEDEAVAKAGAAALASLLAE